MPTSYWPPVSPPARAFSTKISWSGSPHRASSHQHRPCHHRLVRARPTGTGPCSRSRLNLTSTQRDSAPHRGGVAPPPKEKTSMERPIFLVREDIIASIAADAVRLATPDAQIEQALANAPTINNWAIGMPTAFGLTGDVTGHPRVADGRIQTSAAYFIARDFSWVRTMNRFFRLGEPMPATKARIASMNRVSQAND